METINNTAEATEQIFDDKFDEQLIGQKFAVYKMLVYVKFKENLRKFESDPKQAVNKTDKFVRKIKKHIPEDSNIIDLAVHSFNEELLEELKKVDEVVKQENEAMSNNKNEEEIK